MTSSSGPRLEQVVGAYRSLRQAWADASTGPEMLSLLLSHHYYINQLRTLDAGHPTSDEARLLDRTVESLAAASHAAIGKATKSAWLVRAADGDLDQGVTY